MEDMADEIRCKNDGLFTTICSMRSHLAPAIAKYGPQNIDPLETNCAGVSRVTAFIFWGFFDNGLTLSKQNSAGFSRVTAPIFLRFFDNGLTLPKQNSAGFSRVTAPIFLRFFATYGTKKIDPFQTKLRRVFSSDHLFFGAR